MSYSPKKSHSYKQRRNNASRKTKAIIMVLRLTGIVESVNHQMYNHHDSRIDIKVPNFKGLVCLHGYAPDVKPGDYVTATGCIHTHRLYGECLHITQLRIHSPLNRQGQLIQQRINRKLLSSSVLALTLFGLSVTQATRIIKAYGPQTIDIVAKNPYRLAHGRLGIVFKKTDKVAPQCGIPENSPKRAQASLNYALESTVGADGHSKLPREELVRYIRTFSGLPETLIECAIDDQLKACQLVQSDFPVPGSLYVSLPYQVKQQLQEFAHRLALQPTPWDPIDTEQAIPWAENELGFTLTPSQRAIVCATLKSKIMALSGGTLEEHTPILSVIKYLLSQQGLRITEISAKDLPKLSSDQTFSEKLLVSDLVVLIHNPQLDPHRVVRLLKQLSPQTAVIFVYPFDLYNSKLIT
ncbi:MAG: helix-hairpin-helix domain-containing protein, partial [Sutterella sp.]|nr:helix-hairpin-helix domain-containing protein [Sutterella sp.]